MKRRAFLGFLGGAAVSGPTVAKAATADMSSLALTELPNAVPPKGGYIDGADKSWVKDGLKRLLGKSAAQIAYEKRDRHIGALDPNVASLRSVSLVRKIEMTRDIAYEQRERLHETYLRGHLKGWFE